jgi:hypothetical protein
VFSNHSPLDCRHCMVQSLFPLLRVISDRIPSQENAVELVFLGVSRATVMIMMICGVLHKLGEFVLAWEILHVFGRGRPTSDLNFNSSNINLTLTNLVYHSAMLSFAIKPWNFFPNHITCRIFPRDRASSIGDCDIGPFTRACHNLQWTLWAAAGFARASEVMYIVVSNL